MTKTHICTIIKKKKKKKENPKGNDLQGCG